MLTKKSHNEDGESEQDEGQEGVGKFLIACGHRTKVFELVDEPFDAVTLFVKFPVIVPLLLAV